GIEIFANQRDGMLPCSLSFGSDRPVGLYHSLQYQLMTDVFHKWPKQNSWPAAVTDKLRPNIHLFIDPADPSPGDYLTSWSWRTLTSYGPNPSVLFYHSNGTDKPPHYRRESHFPSELVTLIDSENE